MLFSPEEEAKMGVAAFNQLRQKEIERGRLLAEEQGPAAHARVRRVSDRVIQASGLRDRYHWEYMVVNAPETVNAAAISGGRIIIYTGILPVARDDAGLATIIGHEVGHVMAHHTGERMSQDQLMGMAAVAAGAALGASGAPVPPDLAMAVVGLGAQVGVLLPYSRKHESEADEVGQLFMAQAGFDPTEAIALWEGMSQSGGNAPAQWQSTHPSDQTRIAKLKASLPRAMKEYETARSAGRKPVCTPPPEEWINPEALP
jgi:predicted Zn-dependent protease